MSFTILLIFSLYFCAAQSSLSAITKLLFELDLKHSNIIISSINEDKILMKALSYQDDYSKALRINDINAENNDIVLVNTGKIKQQDIQQFLNNNLFHKMLIINFDGIKLHEELYINVGQEVYFYNEITAEVFEAYEINGVKIRNAIGCYNSKSNLLIWNPSIDKNIFRRRANFHGLKLKGMVEHWSPNAFVDNKYMEKATYFESNQTYLANGFVSGVNFDILEHLQEHLNFSTALYKRKVKSYGYVKDWKNGTITGVGMVGDIFFKRADMVISGIMLTKSRLVYVDYLRPLIPMKYGLYISNQAIHDAMEYQSYFKPFQLSSWITILLSILSVGFIKLFIFACVCKNKEDHSFILVGMKLFWSAMKPIFGGKVSNPDIDSGIIQKMILFIWSLCGSIIWIYYRSQITALLSISYPNKPFHDLESMTNTNWR